MCRMQPSACFFRLNYVLRVENKAIYDTLPGIRKQDKPGCIFGSVFWE